MGFWDSSILELGDVGAVFLNGSGTVLIFWCGVEGRELNVWYGGAVGEGRFWRGLVSEGLGRDVLKRHVLRADLYGWNFLCFWGENLGWSFL